MFEFIFYAVLIGIGGTALLDLWAQLLKAVARPADAALASGRALVRRHAQRSASCITQRRRQFAPSAPMN
jgi:hypothetical protein